MVILIYPSSFIDVFKCLTVSDFCIEVVCQSLECCISSSFVVRNGSGNAIDLYLQVGISFDSTIGIELCSHQAKKMVILIYPSSVEGIFEIFSVSYLSIETRLQSIESSVSSVFVVRDGSSDMVELKFNLSNSLIQVCCLLFSFKSNPARSLFNQRLIVLTSIHNRISHQCDESDIAFSSI